MPGDTFGVRTLLPEDEMLKRIEPDYEDLKKASLPTNLTRKTTLKQLVSNFKKSTGPVFY